MQPCFETLMELSQTLTGLESSEGLLKLEHLLLRWLTGCSRGKPQFVLPASPSTGCVSVCTATWLASPIVNNPRHQGSISKYLMT